MSEETINVPCPALTNELREVYAAEWSRLVAQLDRLGELKDDWNGYGAERPNDWALREARMVVKTSLDADLVPVKVAPSARGGVGICFRASGRYADLECFNSGKILGLKSDSEGQIEVFKVESIDAGISTVRKFLFYCAVPPLP